MNGKEFDPLFSEHFIEVRQGFHSFVERIRGSDPNFKDRDQIITDIDITGQKIPMPFDSHAQLRNAYEEMYLALDEGDPEFDQYEQRIRADLMMARVLAGEDVNYDEFSTACVGVPPEKVDQQVINQMRYELTMLLRQKNIGYDDDPENLKAFDSAFLLTNSREIKKVFTQALQLSRFAIGKYVILPEEDTGFEYIDDINAPYSGYMSTDENGDLFMEANIHPSRRYTIGRIRSLAFHEHGGHAIQVLKWKETVAVGKMSPGLGLTAMHSPETTHAEAITAFSQSLLDEVAVSDEDKWIAEFQKLYDVYKMFVEHNYHIMINSGVSFQETLEYATDHLPFESAEKIKVQLLAGRDKPTYRAAYGCYVPGQRLIQPVIDEQDPVLRRRAMVPNYKRSLTMDQAGRVIAKAL